MRDIVDGGPLLVGVWRLWWVARTGTLETTYSHGVRQRLSFGRYQKFIIADDNVPADDGNDGLTHQGFSFPSRPVSALMFVVAVHRLFGLGVDQNEIAIKPNF